MAIILDERGGPNVITWGLKAETACPRCAQMWWRTTHQSDAAIQEGLNPTGHCWLCRQRKEPHSKECRRSPEAGKGKKTSYAVEPPERSTALPTPQCYPSETMSDFLPTQILDNTLGWWGHWFCGKPLQQRGKLTQWKKTEKDDPLQLKRN